MNGGERQCCERSSRGASGRDVGSRQQARACVNADVEALCQDTAEPDTQGDPAKDGLPEKAFAPANQRRLVRHLLVLHFGDAGSPAQHLDETAASPHTPQAER